MKRRIMRTIEWIVVCAGALFLGIALQNAFAQESDNPAYLNPQLSPEQRATDLVRSMTLAEKASQMQNNSAADGGPAAILPNHQLSARTTLDDGRHAVTRCAQGTLCSLGEIGDYAYIVEVCCDEVKAWQRTCQKWASKDSHQLPHGSCPLPWACHAHRFGIV